MRNDYKTSLPSSSKRAYRVKEKFNKGRYLDIIILGDGGTCLAFKPDNEMEYLVGTEEGMIHLCSTEYASEYIRSFKAHNTMVNSVEWSTFLPDVFISCASEFVVKIWSRTYM